MGRVKCEPQPWLRRELIRLGPWTLPFIPLAGCGDLLARTGCPYLMDSSFGSHEDPSSDALEQQTHSAIVTLITSNQN